MSENAAFPLRMRNHLFCLTHMAEEGKIEKGKFPKDIGVILDNAGFLPNETGLKNLLIIAGILKKATREDVEFRRLIERFNRQEGVTVIMTSHHQEDL